MQNMLESSSSSAATVAAAAVSPVGAVASVAQLNIGEESAKLEEEIRYWIDASNEI